MHTNLGQLPLEIVELILVHVHDKQDLYQCTFISKLFYTAANPKLWQTPGQTDSYGNHLLTATSVLKSLQLARDPFLGHHIRKLWFHYGDFALDILLLLTYTPRVEDLYLQQDELLDKDMERIAQLCPHLKRLDLETVEITDRSLAAFGRHCHHLGQLCLSWCHGLSAECLVGLKGCGLERLEINGCHWLGSSQTVTYLDRFDRLTHLTLSSCTTDILQAFVPQLVPTTDGKIPLPGLKGFGIDSYGCHDSPINDSTMVPFIQTHPLLEWLSLSNCRIGDASLMAMVEHLVDLQEVHLDHNHSLSALGVRRLVKGCSRLNHVSIYGCRLLRQYFSETGHEPQFMMELDRNEMKRIRRGAPMDDISHQNDQVSP